MASEKIDRSHLRFGMISCLLPEMRTGPNKQKWHCAEERYRRRENRMERLFTFEKKKKQIPDYGAADNYDSGWRTSTSSRTF